ncbi:uncharacterized protein LOC105250160 isoform X3 [Camponotus floridanus]|uniref:uncharacterized protein LOC105250160 isoform X3 n=1 Tax=Camponotus floridanus TaxID=104421 RepID=UPI000DC6AC42|nr:uncharacterized protein LOC105250160 isoform X3 [Camponotus floridanus]
MTRSIILVLLLTGRLVRGVTETYLMAEQTEIAVSARNDPVLSCHILPRMLDRTVHYCRWIRPDGYGIYNDISHRYTTNSSYSECRLVILNPSLCDHKVRPVRHQNFSQSAVSASQKNLNIDPDSPVISGSLNESKPIL